MALYQRGVGKGVIWHYDFSFNGHRHRGSTGVHDKKAALRVEERERQRVQLGSDTRASLALQDVADAWFIARAEGRKSAVTTAHRVKIMLRIMGPHTIVTTIGMPQVAAGLQRRRLETTRQSAKAKVKRAPSNATINRDLIDSTLRPVLNYARKVLKLPVQTIEWAELRLPEPPERVRAFTAAELAAFRAALPAWHRPVFDFAARYGVRLQEAFFPLAAFDPEAGRVTLRQRKRGGDHSIPLLADDVRAMAAMAGRARAANLPTLWHKEASSGRLEAIQWRGFQTACRTALKRAGIADARPVHDLRHHAATAVMRAAGGNLKVAGKLLGHADLKSTMRYANVGDGDVLDALRHTTGTSAPEPEKKAG